MHPRVFCMKLISEQRLFEAFFDIMPIFGSVRPLSKSTFPFQYIIFQIWQFLEPPSTTPGEIDICAH